MQPSPSAPNEQYHKEHDDFDEADEMLIQVMDSEPDEAPRLLVIPVS